MSTQVVLSVPDDIYEQVEKLAVTTHATLRTIAGNNHPHLFAIPG